MHLEEKAYVILLNWNGWADTLECLESVLRSAYTPFTVIVCDNASTDGSLSHIQAWAEGNLNVGMRANAPLRDLTLPPIPKPIAYALYTREQAERGGMRDEREPRLVLIQTGANLGFAGGNNVGLRYVLARAAFKWVWLLNNDTVVPKDSLRELIARAGRSDRPGITGSTLVYYHAPERVQAFGGAAYNKLIGKVRYVGHGSSSRDIPEDGGPAERQLSYLAGASMLVSAEFLSVVGLMTEDYFLYFEELDWVARNRGRFALAYAPRSTVYHKEGASVGSNFARPSQSSSSADYFSIRSRILYTKRHVPLALPFVYCGLLYSVFNRIRRRQWNRAWQVLRLACGFDFRSGPFQVREPTKKWKP